MKKNKKINNNSNTTLLDKKEALSNSKSEASTVEMEETVTTTNSILEVENKSKNKKVVNAKVVNNKKEKTEKIENENNSKAEKEPSNHPICIKNQDLVSTKNEEQNNKKSHKKFWGICIALITILVLFLIFSTIFALITSNSTKIINGISIKDIDVSGLTKEEALEKLSSSFNEKLSQKITLKHNDYTLDVFPNQFDVSFDLSKAVDSAYLAGRNRNIFQNNYDILVSMISGIKITPSFSFNEDSLNSLIKEMETNFSDKLIDSSYYIDGNNLVLIKGKDGVVINADSLKKEIAYFINNLHCEIGDIEIPVEQKQAAVLNLEKVHEEVYRAPKDAYYTTDPYVVYPHVDGIDFSISIEEAANGYNSSEGSYTIPLKVLSPNVTTNEIGTEAFPDLLGTFSTNFATSNYNRSTNIRLAAAKINGTVVMPGETFSYNQTVGQRTAAAGFKSAAVYSGGEVTTGIGGGICQVSSTLYNSVLLANLDIVERSNHGFNPGYVPAGRDATVSWGGPDFKFKNNRNYPVRVVCTVNGGTILVQIFGLKTQDDYEVEIESYITSYISYKTIQKNDASLPAGTTKVLQSGSSGCRSVCYRILKRNGETVSKTLLSNDTYSPHNKVVAVGTGS